MARGEESEFDQILHSVGRVKLNEEQSKCDNATGDGGERLPVTCFTEAVNDAILHFQIIHLPRQLYVWVSCGSSKFGNLYAAASTRPSNTVSVTSLFGGTSDNTGSGVAQRLALKTGLNIIMACNIPKNNPMLEANAEKVLIRRLLAMGYTRQKSEGSSS